MPKSKLSKDGDTLLVAGPGGATHQTANSAEGSLTTNQGVVVADNQNTFKSGERGPSLLEDFQFREKITHFDHERIPERIVHARGSGAHGVFEVTNPIPPISRGLTDSVALHTAPKVGLWQIRRACAEGIPSSSTHP